MKTTTTILKKNFLQIVGFCLVAIYSANAQEGTTILPGTTFAGSADFYYKYDFAEVDNSYTSFTHSHDSYEIGMASIEASHKLEKASIFVDLGFGSRASEFTYNDSTNTFMIKQMYITYDFSASFKVTAGSFGTHIGYELVDAVDNKNYSMSYAFTNGPFFNTGVKAQYTSGKYSFMAGIAFLNFTTGSNNYNRNLGANTNSAFDVNKTQFDFVGSRKLNTNLTLGFNGTYAMVEDDNNSDLDKNWFSLVGYLNYAFKGKWSVAYRLEYFDNKDGAIDIDEAKSSIIGNTLSLNYKEGNFTFIPEVRFDSSSEDIFKKKDGSTAGSSAYVLFATTYSF